MRYKVLRVYELEADNPQQAMNRACEQHVVFQKVTPAQEKESGWSDALQKQFTGKGGK